MTDVETLASYIEGEAGGEGDRGMRAVANVMDNRARQNFSGYGRDLVSQATAWNQFQGHHTPSEAARTVARDLVAGNLPDITGGAIYYARPENSTAGWARRLNESNSYRIGHHLFTSNTEGRVFRGPDGGEIADRRRPDDRLASDSPKRSAHVASTAHAIQRHQARRRDSQPHRVASRTPASQMNGRMFATRAGSDSVPFVVTTTVTVTAA